MIYSKFVEIGRVVFIAQGKNTNKLAVIVDVVDGNRVSSLNFTQIHSNFSRSCSMVPQRMWSAASEI
jgi:hypothetical protein